ncbi:MAG: hypothetical protein OEZ47_15825, partial [Gammaproteobacteria bacterium]|nr:hypothetical protein [Gammaproteobacteria bacterium]
LGYAYERIDEKDRAAAQYREILRNRVDMGTANQAKFEIDRINQELNIYAYNFNYGLTQEWYYYPNSGVDVSYRRSSLTFDVRSRFKMANYTSINVGFTPAYTVNQSEKTDSYDPSYMFSTNYDGPVNSLSLSTNYRLSENVLLDLAKEKNITYSASWNRTLKFPLYLEDEQGFRSKRLGFNVSQTQREVSSGTAVETSTLRLESTLSIPTIPGGNVFLSLSRSEIEPKGNTISDWGEVTNELMLQVNQTFNQTFRAQLTLSYEAAVGSEPDLFENFRRGREIKRTRDLSTVSLSLTHWMHPEMPLTFSYTMRTQKTNLPATTTLPISYGPYIYGSARIGVSLSF